MAGSARPILEPSPEHPITIEANPARVVVTVAGRVIADTTKALTLREASYRPVQYIPREDVREAELAPSDHTSYCPFKGDCSYFSVPSGGEHSLNAAWTYTEPYAAVAEIAGHIAFYPERVEQISESPAD
jgi:uncharacterized protein (DUF427 family)